MRLHTDSPDERHLHLKPMTTRLDVAARRAAAEPLREPAWKKHVGTLDREIGEELRRSIEAAAFSRIDG